MDNIKGIWHGLVFKWPVKMILDKCSEDLNSIVGEISFVESGQKKLLKGSLKNIEGFYYIRLNSDKHEYIGMVRPDYT